MTEFFPHFKTNVSHDSQGQIRGQNQGKKVIVPKHADSRNFLTEMESLGNFLQNATKFVEIFQVVAEISQFEFRQVPPFFGITPIFEEAYLQNYSPNFNKIKNLGVFILTLPPYQISCKSEMVGLKIEKSLSDMRWNDLYANETIVLIAKTLISLIMGMHKEGFVSKYCA